MGPPASKARAARSALILCTYTLNQLPRVHRTWALHDLQPDGHNSLLTLTREVPLRLRTLVLAGLGLLAL